MRERKNWIICGRKIGTGLGWDDADTFALTVYGVEPLPQWGVPPGDYMFDFDKGTITRYDNDDGTELYRADLIEILALLPRE